MGLRLKRKAVGLAEHGLAGTRQRDQGHGTLAAGLHGQNFTRGRDAQHQAQRPRIQQPAPQHTGDQCGHDVVAGDPDSLLDGVDSRDTMDRS